MCKIYLVDDEQWVIDEIKYLLQNNTNGFEVCGANTSPLKAMDEILKLSPQILICDIFMTELNGIELVRKIKEKNKTIRVCFLSAYDRFDYAKEAILLGACDFIVKPVSQETLFASLITIKSQFIDDVKQNSTLQIDIAQNVKNISKIIDKILEDIKLNYMNKLTLNDYANKFFFNPSYLSQLFKKCVHKSFIDFVIEFRIEKAKELMLTTDLNMAEIAYSVGYVDYFHFSKLFKKHTDFSPSDYKQSLINS